MSEGGRTHPSLIGLALVTALTAYLGEYFWTRSFGDDLVRVISIFLLALACAGSIRLVAEIWRRAIEFWRVLRSVRRGKTRGSAAFLTEREARRAGLHKRTQGSRFAGILGGTALWLWTETHHLVLGPAGSAKSSAAIFNFLCSMAESCLVNDTKGEIYEVTAAMRARKFGHRIVKLDPTDPESERVNPLDFIYELVAEDSPEALTLLRGMALQLYPEPKEEGQNKFFRDGSRRLISGVTAAVTVVCPPELRTLAMVYRALTNLDTLHELLMEAGQSGHLAGEVAAMAEDIHQMAFGEDGAARTFEQFRIGALGALEAFGPGNYLAHITGATTFSFAELKTGKVTCYLIVDYNNKETLGKWSGLMQWLATYQIVRFRDKRPVTMVLDEFCNSPLYTLPNILTLLRSYGVRCIMATQDLDDITRVYGKHALESVLSETDIKQFLGGIRSKTTLDYLSKYMGEYTEHSPSYAFGEDRVQESLGRTNRALMTADEIRRLGKQFQIILYGNLKPILASKVQVYAVDPWRSEIGVNSIHGGKRYLLPVELVIKGGRARVLKRANFEETRERRFWPVVGSLWRALGPGRAALAIGILLAVMWLAGFPYLRVQYAYSGSWSNASAYHWCQYLGPRPFVIRGGDCPIIIFRDVW